MIKTIKHAILAVASLSLLATPLLVPAVASAANNNTATFGGVCSGTDLTTSGAKNSNCSSESNQATTKINSLLTSIINVASVLVGLVSVLFIIVGGFKYITSGGDTNNMASAKNTIIYALVGLVIVALAQFLVHFVLGKVTSA